MLNYAAMNLKVRGFITFKDYNNTPILDNA